MNKLNENLVLARSRASDLENVRKLNCWGSSLNDVSILRRMPNIQVVSLSVNEITSLADFAYCENLEEIYIRKNNIQDLSEICHLCKLPKLRNLWLADNPCATGDLYRLTVLRTLPNLQKLDNIAVQQEEINDALERGVELKLGKGPVTAAVTPPMIIECDYSNSGSTSAARPAPLVRRSTYTSPVRHSPSSSPRTKTKVMMEGVEKMGMSDSDRDEEEERENPITLTWEETNRIRAQLGLRLLPVEKVTPLKPRSFHSAKQRNANILQACLHLIKELDVDSLEVVSDAIRSKMEAL